MGNFYLSNEDKTYLQKIYEQRDVQIPDSRYNQVRVSLQNDLAGILISSITSTDIIVDDSSLESLLSGVRLAENRFEEDARDFSLGFASALILGYFQSYNYDRETDVSHVVEFGYNSLDAEFCAIISKADCLPANKKVAECLIQNGLGVKIRDCDASEYFSTPEYYKSDIKYLYECLLVEDTDGYNTKMLNAIANESTFITALGAVMADLDTVYKYLFEDGFGTKPYVGVYRGDSSFITIDNKLNSKEITNGRVVLKQFADRITRIISSKVVISDKRQFDYDEIYSNPDKVVYFPYKILEYALGRESTLRVNEYKYAMSASSVSWDKYYKEYVSGNLKQILLYGYYKALEEVLYANDAITSGFTTTKFASDNNLVSDEDYSIFVSDALIKYSMNVQQLFRRLQNSISCAYILSRYSFLANQISAFALRVTNGVDFNCFTVGYNMSETLFKNLVSSNSNERFTSPIDITSGRVSKRGVDLSCHVYEYQYDVNPILSSAEPLFGYVIQRQNQKRGVPCNWDRILIGESSSGTELYASSNEDIKLQNYFIHNIYAGSRSGKGVMTMNILASAVASGKPVFYLDGKPDMGSMLYGLSNGEQFIVNSGTYEREYDTTKSFDENSGDALLFWREKSLPYLKENPKILNLFDLNAPSYTSVLGDYIYFRAFMFCIGLCVLRSKMKGLSDDVRDSYFNGDSGIVIIVDELTRFQTSMAKIFGSFESTMVKKAREFGDTDSVLQRKEELERQIDVLQLKVEEAQRGKNPKESTILELTNKIEKLRVEINNLFDVQALYAASLYLKIRDSYTSLINSKVASFKDKEFKYSDIFVLGQILDADYYASSIKTTNKGTISPVFFPMKSDGSGFYSGYNNADIVRSFLEEFGDEDWFLGRNPGYNYADKTEGSQVKKWLDDNGNWSYVGAHTANEVRHKEDASFSSILFKSYLVLNMHYEENPANTTYNEKGEPVASDPKFQYVTQCRDRVNKTAGTDLWKDIRVKHLNEAAKEAYSEDSPQYNELDEGVGFAGLVRDTMLTSDPTLAQNVNMDDIIAQALSKSGKAANYVATKMGYSCWQDLIFDFSPRGLFSFDDIVNAVLYPEKYSYESRLPLYAKLGVSVDTSSSTIYEHGGVVAKEFTGFNFNYSDSESSSNSAYNSSAKYRDVAREYYENLLRSLLTNLVRTHKKGRYVTDEIFESLISAMLDCLEAEGYFEK